jgi:uncharacterized membrane protein YcaP (DUF421 family)
LPVPQGADAFAMVWKAAFFYVLLVALLRVMGKREINSLTPVDLVVFIMLSEAAIISIEDKQIPLLVGVAPVLTLAAMEMITAFLSLKFVGFRALVEGKPTVVIEHGRINPRQMARLRLNVDDLQAELRQKNLTSFDDVEFAILETSGKLSVIPKAAARPATARDVGQTGGGADLPVDLIVDGVINRDGLRAAGHDEAWLRRQLGHLRPEDVLVCTVDRSGKLFVQPKPDRQHPGRPPAPRTLPGPRPHAKPKKGDPSRHG